MVIEKDKLGELSCRGKGLSYGKSVCVCGVRACACTCTCTYVRVRIKDEILDGQVRLYNCTTRTKEKVMTDLCFYTILMFTLRETDTKL